MLEHRLTAWLRPVLSFLALAGLLSLAACGGGGSPNNPYTPGPTTPPPLVVQPGSLNIFSNIPATLTITSGLAPFTVFSDTPTILPVQQAVPGNTVVLLANSVTADTAVVVTVRDAAGQSVNVPVTVKPAPLLNNLAFAPTGTDCGSDLCSAQTGTARIQALGPGGAPLVGRQIRFDIVYGPIFFNTNNPGQPQAQTVTVVADNAGRAEVSVQALANATTQPAQIRATDLTSGNVQIVNFNVVNSSAASQSPITVVPSTATITGTFINQCSTGFRIDYYVFGGTPPYTVQSTFPAAVQLVNNVVTQSGGFFEAVTNGTCVNPLQFTVTDSAGKQTTAQLINQPGTQTPTPPPTPPPLAVNPNNVTDTGCGGKTYTFIVTGGTPAYNISGVSNPSLPNSGTVNITPQVIGGSGGQFAVTFPSGGQAPTPGTVTTLLILDSSPTQLQTTARITCN